MSFLIFTWAFFEGYTARGVLSNEQCPTGTLTLSDTLKDTKLFWFIAHCWTSRSASLELHFSLTGRYWGWLEINKKTGLWNQRKPIIPNSSFLFVSCWYPINCKTIMFATSAIFTARNWSIAKSKWGFNLNSIILQYDIFTGLNRSWNLWTFNQL